MRRRDTGSKECGKVLQLLLEYGLVEGYELKRRYIGYGIDKKKPFRYEVWLGGCEIYHEGEAKEHGAKLENYKSVIIKRVKELLKE